MQFRAGARVLSASARALVETPETLNPYVLVLISLMAYEA